MTDHPIATTRFARGPATHGHHRVTYVELFFDLVFVFAITQLSHGLMHHPSWLGLYETTLMTMAVWWVWIYTSWATNWADPDKVPVRLALFALMGGGLVLSMAIPKAFEGRAMAFACAYAGMQVLRSAAMIPVMREYSAGHEGNFRRLTLWMLPPAALWIAGAWYGGTAQLVLWTLAVALDYLAPAIRYYVPGLGHSSVEHWNIEPAHFAERCALFVIIALGESILVTGATFADLVWTGETAAAFVASFAGSVAMWWIYFNIGQERGVTAMARSASVGLIGRAYTYVHLFIVGGIIVTAVADEFVLKHAGGHADGKTVAALVGGAALYIAGCAQFKRSTAGWYPLSHSVGLGLLALLGVLGGALAPWLLSVLVALVLSTVAIWERCSLGPDAVSKIGHPRERERARAAQAPSSH